MAKSIVSYSREFQSQTAAISHFEDGQEICDEDKRIRQEAISFYAFQSYARPEMSSRHQGFDGNQQYEFHFSEKINKFPNSKITVPYTTQVNIRKAGAQERLAELSDLETFLLEKGFEKN